MLLCMYNKKSINLTRRTQMNIQDTSLANITAPTLNSSAMLVEVNISKWEGRKLDKKASAEVTHNHNANSGIANVHKKLLGDCQELDTIKKFVSNARNIHYAMTLPWSKSGLQLIPTSLYFKYNKQMSELQQEFHRLCDNFFAIYEQSIVDAKDKLGTLFHADNYPSLESIRSKFKWSMNYIPLPESGDFRIDIGNEGLKEVQERYASFYEEQLSRSMNTAWHRLHDVLSRMSERLDYSGTEDKKTFRDTLVTNVADVVDLLDHFNLTGNADMKLMKSNLDKALRGVTPDALREDSDLRQQTKQAVDKAIKALPSLDI